MADSQFVEDWNLHAQKIEQGIITARRSSRASLMTMLDERTFFKPRALRVRFDASLSKGKSTLALTPPKETGYTPFDVKDGKLNECSLKLNDPSTAIIDGLGLVFSTDEHSAQFEISAEGRYWSLVHLRLESAFLMPAVPESARSHFAQRNMSAREVSAELEMFIGAWHNSPIYVAMADATDTSDSSRKLPYIEIEYENNQPDRDAVWTMTLYAKPLIKPTASLAVQISHAPFSIARIFPPTMDPEAGEIAAQWRSDDTEGAQWRFAVETATLHLPPQAVGEAMERGKRFWNDPGLSPISGAAPVNHRFSRVTQLRVRPMRRVRRYTVHPGDMLSILKDAQVEHFVTEMAYPLEVTYERSERAQKTVRIAELANLLGQPAISLKPAELPKRDFSVHAAVSKTLRDAMSDRLADWYADAHNTDDGFCHGLLGAYQALRKRHLADRASFQHRLAQFPLLDAQRPDAHLNLREDLTARLRNRLEGSAAAFPLPEDVSLDAQGLADTAAFIPEALAIPPKSDNPWPPPKETPEQAIKKARALPIGFLNSFEFASEMRAVLRQPVSQNVHLADLAFSVLGATGSMKAAFDEGRTVFEVDCADGQASRLIKTRVGRISVAWNRARHVVIYARSTVPSAQFQQEQEHGEHYGRPIIRKVEEYVEILEPRRLFGTEASSESNRAGCLHSFSFATKRIYVNGAWGRDLGHGYEIPLYDPLDQTGFYVKPWLGPVAHGADDELVSHWHEHPEYVYFYSNTEQGKGQDTDKWDAQAELDWDRTVTFGPIASETRMPGKNLLPLKTVPSYTLQAAANPRFAMQVKPDGPANLAHGRAKNKLVAPLCNFHIERTNASSRVSFDDKNLVSEPDAQQLWLTVKGAAEARAAESTIGHVLQDADALWNAIGATDCPEMVRRLKQETTKAFAEARLSVSSEVTNALHTVADDPNFEKLAEQQQTLLVAKLKGNLKLPRLLIAMASSDAAEHVASLRNLLEQLKAAADDTQRAAMVKSMNREFEAIGIRQEPAEVVGIQRVLLQAADALGGSVAFINAATADINNAITDLCQAPAYSAMASWLQAAQQELTQIRDQVTIADMKTRLDTWLKQNWNGIDRFRESLRVTLDTLDKRRYPVEMEAIHTVRKTIEEHGRHILFELERLDKSVRYMRDKQPKIADDEIDTLKMLITERLIGAVGQMEAAISAAVAYPATGVTTGVLGILDNARNELVALQKALRNVSIAAIATLLDDVKKAIDKVTGAVDSGTALDDALATLNDALQKLQETVQSAGETADSVLVVAYQKATADLYDKLGTISNAIVSYLKEAQKTLVALLTAAATSVADELIRDEEIVQQVIDGIDCAHWENAKRQLSEEIDKVAGSVRNYVAERAGKMLDEDTRRQVKQLADAVISKVEQGKEDFSRIAPRAAQAIKLVKLLSDRPELPQITVNCDRIEYVLDDVRQQIDASPFVARLREFDAGIKELGLALPTRAIAGELVLDNLQGARFKEVFRQLAIDFDEFLDKFRLPTLPTGAVKFSHHIDPKRRMASAKVEIDHTFKSTEQIFEVASFSLDIRNPRVQASSNFDVAEHETKARTRAQFRGDWILNFGGQPLVTFHDANIQYSDEAGFKFDLDPAKVEPHPALLFITMAFREKMPKLPDGVKIEKDENGRPVGASIAQESNIGPYDIGSVYIGEATLASRFALRVVSGRMTLDSSFSLGTTASPVFLQVGIYGGGGWLKARSWLDYTNGRLEPRYSSSIGISLGSTRSFTLASVATGTYAIRLFLEATIDSSGANAFAAGVSVVGSARILGYLNAYLELLLEVEHQAGGSMKGRGRIDIEIEICWCYSVRVNRSVEQNI